MKSFNIRWITVDGPKEFNTEFYGEAVFQIQILLKEGFSFTVENFSN